MSKVLVTGGAGFIGSHVAQLLLSRGDEVVIIDDFNTRYDPRLKEARVINLLSGQNKLQLVRHDIRDKDFILDFFAREKFQGVIHLAAWASVQQSIEDPFTYASVNVEGTTNILEGARRSGTQKIIFASTSSVYGNRDTILREADTTDRPLSPYAATKLAGELLCAAWHHLYGIPTTCLRFFTVYGPWGRPEMALFKFTEAIVKGEPIEMRGHTTRRDFTYIDDIVRGVVAAYDHASNFSVYNLGNHDDVLLPRFIQAIENSLHKKAIIKEVPLKVGDVPRTLADISKAGQELHWQPQIPIEEGVPKFCDWYLNWYVPHLGS